MNNDMAMNNFPAKAYPYSVLAAADGCGRPYPYLKEAEGDLRLYSVSPEHGRSFVIGKNGEGRWVVSKGNGLGYSQCRFLNTAELGDDTWGLLLKQDALRDFNVGNEVAALGIRTNRMEYVLELDCPVAVGSDWGRTLKPVLLQYTVECPYRISDAPFIDKEIIRAEVEKWKAFDRRGGRPYHEIAAEVLIGNLRILHDKGILHNAISAQNHSWALELLDFELASSPEHPYSSEDSQRHVPDLFPREVIFTYQTINYLAGVLGEREDFASIDGIFRDYGFGVDESIT